MASPAQRRAVARYEAKRQRPGVLVSVRMPEILFDAVRKLARPGERMPATIRRLLAARVRPDNE